MAEAAVSPAEQDALTLKGMVFDIQRYSIHDGPGIRTTIFLKGCPLHCLWCHNPESMSPRPQVGLTPSRCIACEECMKVCPHGVHAKDERGERVWRNELCQVCGACTDTCYAEALELIGREMSVADVLTEIERERPFFETSGGGMTVSGGEPLLQPDFTRALLRACRERGIHTCLDTSGFARWEVLESVLPWVNMVLYDLKHMDSTRHRELTGVPNEQILANLTLLAQTDIPIFVRVPTVTGCNADAGNFTRMAEFLAGLAHVPEVNLLPYHQLGISKYRRIGKAYELEGVAPPDEATMATLRGILEARGLKVHVGA